jgi:hypothetical protein|tara:strand:+ start:9702 stop:11033 length:1332 start_codon:yes stop_codon:yes gene_type:complete
MGALSDRLAGFFDERGSLTDDGRIAAAVAYMICVVVVLRRVKFFLIRLFPSNVLEFVPYKHDAKGTDTVCVDCTHKHLPTLTHHKESSTPDYLKGTTGDTSTDVVLNALTHPTGWAPARTATKVTCNHFDIDGLLSVWALIHPLKARRHEELLRACARLGDLRELGLDMDRRGNDNSANSHQIVPPGSLSDQALRFCCFVNAVETQTFTAPFVGDEFEESRKKYKHFLPIVSEVIDIIVFHAEVHAEAASLGVGDTSKSNGDDIDASNASRKGAYADGKEPAAEVETKRIAMKTRATFLELSLGDAERATVLRDLHRLFDETKTQIAFNKNTNVVFIKTADETPFHYYASFSVEPGADVVVCQNFTKYEIEQRYVTFVDLRSRPTTPRLDMAVLAKRLNALEQKRNFGNATTKRWDVSGFTDSGPLLRINCSENRLSKAQVCA